MDYKKQTSKLTLREFGRNLQGLIQKTQKIEDRNIRTKMVHDLVRHMQILYPANKDAIDYKKKLWETVYRIANYELDVDCPYEISKPEAVVNNTKKIDYPKSKANIKHYGSIIDALIDRACRLEAGPERQRLVLIIANMMKMFNQQFAGGVASDEIIFEHINQLSKGQIKLNTADTTLRTTPLPQITRNSNSPKHHNSNRGGKSNNNKRDNKYKQKGRANNNSRKSG